MRYLEISPHPKFIVANRRFTVYDVFFHEFCYHGKMKQNTHAKAHFTCCHTSQAEDPVGGDSYDPDVSYDRRETYSPGSSWESSSPQTSYEEKTKSKIQQFPQGMR